VACGVRAWLGWENHALCRPAEGKSNTPQPEDAEVKCIDNQPVLHTTHSRCVDPTHNVRTPPNPLPSLRLVCLSLHVASHSTLCPDVAAFTT